MKAGESEANEGSSSNNQQSNNRGTLDPQFIATYDNPTPSLLVVVVVFSGSNFVHGVEMLGVD